MALTPAERREQSSPLLIAIFTAFVSPLSSLIWGLRQRSWSLAFAPFAVAFTFMYITALETDERSINKGVQYSFQLSSGIIAYEISKNLKSKAEKKNTGIKIK
tara:strand:- start:116 stop:424 length:309 start_codon:yes stop_codon:yes gene_type:complete